VRGGDELLLWRLRHNTARPDILAADEAQSVETLFCLVTTGLDPVVHADSHHTRRFPMDWRIKSGNDGWNRRHFYSVSVTDKRLAHLRDVFSRHT
jgi:hypothetical protein